MAVQAQTKIENKFLSGQVVFGGYRVLTVVGSGRTSTVYVCRRLSDEQFVAIKVINPEAAGDKSISRRFRNELFFTYQIRHPHVVRGFEFMHSAEGEAFSMEYVDGPALENSLRRGKKISPQNTLRILEQVCTGLEAIHGAGLIHRDLKPENILMSTSGGAKICDFNTAVSESSGRNEIDTGVIGTLPYISPEVLTTGRADCRSDIYALGVMGYRMVTGQLPYSDKDEKLCEAEIVRGRLACPRTVNEDCPRKLAAVIRTAMDRNPIKRFQTANEMLSAIRAAM